MQKHAIIVAGGTGTRMKGEVPKQFMLLNGKPVIQYSLGAFYACETSINIIVVVHPDFTSYWKELCREHQISVPHIVVKGGETRFDSVKNGLDLIANEGLVAVHDAARPLINADFIKHLFSTAENFGSAMPGIPLNDTIRQIDGDTSSQLDRSFLRAMQTPQVYSVSELKRAYTQPFRPIFTDEASVMQSAGFAVHLTEGRRWNIKITNPEDIGLAEVLLAKNL
jgi:2-C-methyl-D-erythritol 4-phosphate cytidylyltransferase